MHIHTSVATETPVKKTTRQPGLTKAWWVGANATQKKRLETQLPTTFGVYLQSCLKVLKKISPATAFCWSPTFAIILFTCQVARKYESEMLIFNISTVSTQLYLKSRESGKVAQKIYLEKKKFGLRRSFHLEVNVPCLTPQ